MHVEVVGDLAIDRLQELLELDRAVAARLCRRPITLPLVSSSAAYIACAISIPMTSSSVIEQTVMNTVLPTAVHHVLHWRTLARRGSCAG